MRELSNLQELSDHIFSACPNKPCITQCTRFRTLHFSYADVITKIRKTETWLLQSGLKKGDSVIICAPNDVTRAALYFACIRLGLVMVPLDTHSDQSFAAGIAQVTDAKAAFTALPVRLSFDGVLSMSLARLEQEASELKENETHPVIDGNDVLQIVYTSGTTGDPKGVVLTHNNVTSNVLATLKHIPVRKDHRLLSILPMSHMLEQTVGFLVPLMNEASIVYPAMLTPLAISKAMKSQNITSIVCVPAFMRMIRDAIERERRKNTVVHLLSESVLRSAKLAPSAIKRSYTFPVRRTFAPRLELLITGGAPAEIDVIDWWETLGIKVLQGYGLTESSPIVAATPMNDRRPDTVGTFLHNIEYTFTEANELWIRGESVSKEYFKNPEATESSFEDGWYKTGDICECDNDGFLHIKGRSKNMILSSSGINVYPEDIEAVLNGFAEVKESVVLGVQNENDTQIIAYVLPRSPQADVDALRERANRTLAAHQKVKRVLIWPESDFPRTNTRKIKRNLIIAPDDDARPEKPKTETDDTLLRIICEVSDTDVSAVSDASVLSTDMGFDSLMKLVLLSRIEEELYTELDDSAINTQTSVADLRKLLAEQKSQGSKIESRWPYSSFVRSVRTHLFQPMALFFVRRKVKSIRHEGNSPDNDRPCIFVANHSSHLDVFAVLGACSASMRSRLTFAAAQDYFFKNTVQSFLVRLILAAFPWNRHAGLRNNMKRFGYVLDSGCSVLIFPEGTRSANGMLQDLKPGIGVLALSMNCPIVPVRISGAYEALPKGASKIRPTDILVRFGDAYMPNPDASAVDITDDILCIMKKMQSTSPSPSTR